MYKRIINLTFTSVLDNKSNLIKALVFPIIALVFIQVLSQETSLSVMALTPVNLLVNIFIAIITHRVLLLGANSVPKWGLLSLSKREGAFFINSFLMMLIAIPFSLLGFIPVVGLPLAVICILIILSRLSLVFPAIAIDEKITLTQAWEFTKEYKLLTFFSIILFPLIFGIIVGVVYNLVIGFLIGIISPKLYILYPLLDVFMAVFIISALSSTYLIIREDHPEFFDTSKEEQDEDITIINNNEKFYYDEKAFSINFELLKKELLKQYESLGFTNIAVDNEKSWMIKNPEVENAYVSVTEENYLTFKIEAYNVQEANLEFLKKTNT